ncbi:hypothetical protein [Nonomuraea sp. KM88]|uniref:hypothetical protein n=1 Tax=Nonomuraea sp. KM88 TaxID=3457427 RepID=UPI003FCC8DBE
MRVHARRPHGDAYLTRAGVGLLGIDEVQDIRAAELGRTSPSCPRCAARSRPSCAADGVAART